MSLSLTSVLYGFLCCPIFYVASTYFRSVCRKNLLRVIDDYLKSKMAFRIVLTFSIFNYCVGVAFFF